MTRQYKWITEDYIHNLYFFSIPVENLELQFRKDVDQLGM